MVNITSSGRKRGPVQWGKLPLFGRSGTGSVRDSRGREGRSGYKKSGKGDTFQPPTEDMELGEVKGKGGERVTTEAV